MSKNSQRLKTAYHHGQTARKNNGSRSDNPYQTKDLRSEWNQGFTKGPSDPKLKLTVRAWLDGIKGSHIAKGSKISSTVNTGRSEEKAIRYKKKKALKSRISEFKKRFGRKATSIEYRNMKTWPEN